jgi:hypothetical protein
LQARPRERKEGMFRKEVRARPRGRFLRRRSWTAPCGGARQEGLNRPGRDAPALGRLPAGQACAGAGAREAFRSRPSVLETPPTSGVPNAGGDLAEPADWGEPAAAADSDVRRRDPCLAAWGQAARARRRAGWARRAPRAVLGRCEGPTGMVLMRRPCHRSSRGPGEPSERAVDPVPSP